MPPASGRNGATVGIVAVVGLVVAALVVAKASDDPDPRSPAAPVASAVDGGWARDDIDALLDLVTDGERVCSTVEDELFCIDGANGEEIFSVTLPGEATSVTLVGETLVVGADGGSERGDVYGFSLDGDLLWETPENLDVHIGVLVGFASAFPAAGGVVAVPVGEYGEDGIVGLDARSGEVQWRREGVSSQEPVALVGDFISDGQHFYGDAMYVDVDTGGSSTGIVAVDPTSGALVWQLAMDDYDDTFLREAVLFDDDTSVALGLYGESSETVVVDATTGGVRWRIPMDTDWGDVAFLDNMTVVADGPVVAGYDREGVELWVSDQPDFDPTDQDGSALSPNLVMAGGRLFALGLADLVTIDPASGGTETVLTDHFPSAVAVAEDFLVVSGEGLHAVPLDQLP